MTAVEFIESCKEMSTKDGYNELVAIYINQQFCKDITLLIESKSKAIPELSDEEIEEEYDLPSWVDGAKWYREQLKQRQ